MTLLKYKLEGTDGVTITPGNSGTPALSAVVASGSATAQYKTAAAFDGSTGGTFTSDGTNAAYAQAPFNASASTWSMSGAFTVPPALPATDYAIGSFYDTANARIMSVIYRTTGTIVLSDKSSVYSPTILTAGQATAGTKFRIEIQVSTLSATVGAYQAQVFNSSNTAVGTNANVSNANLGTVNASYFRFGATTSAAMTVSWDSIQLNDGSTTAIGRLTGNTTPPTIAAIADQTISANGTVTLNAVATPFNGDTIASYSWTCTRAVGTDGTILSNPTLTGGTTASPTFPISTKARYEFSVTATDSSGNVSAAQTARVFYPDTKITPIIIGANAGWTIAGVASLSDSSDTTYGDSGATGSGNQLIVVLAPIVAPPTAFQLIVHSLVQAVGGTQQVELLDTDGTVRKNWGALGPGLAFADQPLNLTSGEIATVTNWNAVQIRLTQV